MKEATSRNGSCGPRCRNSTHFVASGSSMCAPSVWPPTSVSNPSGSPKHWAGATCRHSTCGNRVCGNAGRGWYAFRDRLAVLFDPGLMRHETGHDAAAGRRADRIGAVGFGEAHAGGGEAVHGRGFQIGIAVGAESGHRLLVGHDQNDVGFASLRPSARNGRQSGRRYGSEKCAARYVPRHRDLIVSNIASNGPAAAAGGHIGRAPPRGYAMLEGRLG